MAPPPLNTSLTARDDEYRRSITLLTFAMLSTFARCRYSVGGLLPLVQYGGDWAEPQPAQANHRVAVSLYIIGLLLCNFNVSIKELTANCVCYSPETRF